MAITWKSDSRRSIGHWLNVYLWTKIQIQKKVHITLVLHTGLYLDWLHIVVMPQVMLEVHTLNLDLKLAERNFPPNNAQRTEQHPTEGTRKTGWNFNKNLTTSYTYVSV